MRATRRVQPEFPFLIAARNEVICVAPLNSRDFYSGIRYNPDVRILQPLSADCKGILHRNTEKSLLRNENDFVSLLPLRYWLHLNSPAQMSRPPRRGFEPAAVKVVAASAASPVCRELPQ